VTGCVRPERISDNLTHAADSVAHVILYWAAVTNWNTMLGRIRPQTHANLFRQRMQEFGGQAAVNVATSFFFSYFYKNS